MFKELTPLLRKGDTLALTIAREPDGAAGPVFRVNIMPKLFTLDGELGEDRKALNTPLSIVGSAEELDSAEFTATLDRFRTSATELRNTINAAEAAHKSRTEEKKKEPAPAAGKKEKKKGKRGRPPATAQKPAEAKTGKRRGRPPGPGKAKDQVAAALAVPESVTGDAKVAEPENPETPPAKKAAKSADTAEDKTNTLI